jgi:hypothetical protein
LQSAFWITIYLVSAGRSFGSHLQGMQRGTRIFGSVIEIRLLRIRSGLLLP